MNLSDAIELLGHLPKSTEILSMDVIMGKQNFYHRYIDDKISVARSAPQIGRMRKILTIYRGKPWREENESI